MSRRKQRARDRGAAEGEGGRGPAGRGAGDAARGPAGRGAGARARGGAARDRAGRPASASRSAWSLSVQIGFAVAVFAVAVLVAELAGAANLGVSFGVGQIAFAIAVAFLLMRR